MFECEDIEINNIVEQSFIFGYQISKEVEKEKLMKVDHKEKSLLDEMYDKFFIEEVVKDNNNSLNLRKDLGRRYEQLLNKLDNEQKRELEEMSDIAMDVEAIVYRGNFIQGYTYGSKMTVKVMNKY